MKILIAEDDPVSRQIIERTLQNWGHEVIVTENGLDAWDAFQKEDIRFAVLDWMMPDIDGVELCKRIREMEKDAYTYLILLTAKSQKYDIVQGLKSGADDYIIKPFNHDELHSRISTGERILSLEEKLASRIAEIEESNTRMRKDILAASRIQKNLLPEESCNDNRIRIEYAFFPCEHVGGDMLNFFKLNDRYYGFYISDVSGHGVSAAMQAVTISRMLLPHPDQSSICLDYNSESEIAIAVEPHIVLERLNQRLQIYDDSFHYATMIYGVLDLETLQLKYVRAGHSPMMLLRDKKVKHIKDQGSLPLGINSSAEYIPNTLQLQKGDRLFLFTDGVIETDKTKKIQVEIAELESKFERFEDFDVGMSLLEIAKESMIRDENSPPSDDITIMCVMILE